MAKKTPEDLKFKRIKDAKSSKKRRKKKRDACMSMNSDINRNNTDTTSPIEGHSKAFKRLSSGKPTNQSPFANMKTYTKYDDGFEHSQELHLDACKHHQQTWFDSFKKRKFITTDLADFKALIGKGGLYADHMPASDLRLRYAMGKFILREMKILFERWEADPSMQVYWITFVDDRYMFNERGGTAEVFKLVQAVQAAIRNYTPLNAFGVIENQAIINYPEGQKGKMLSVHAHVLCWGKESDVKELMKRAKGFKSSITKLPIHIEKVHQLEGSMSRVSRYMPKPPYGGKEVNFEKLENGERCLYPARRLELYHHLRLLEFLAKLPMEYTIFGVGEGKEVRKRIVGEMKSWQQKRKGNVVNLGDRVYALFETFLRENKRLKNYQPLIVNYKRNGRDLQPLRE